MYIDQLKELGLAQNEAKIYETLLREGECGVGHIATKSEVHRRNVYDSLNRLMEKGLVFEITEDRENKYQAASPQRLSEILEERQDVLADIMPNLEMFYNDKPTVYKNYTYRGKEGLKNYLRDLLRVNEEFYCIGASGGWLDPRISDFLKYFDKQVKRQGIKMHHLFDYETQEKASNIFDHVGNDYKILPQKYTTGSSVDIFGDRVAMLTELNKGSLDEDIIITVIVSPTLADSFRTWYKLIWDLLPDRKD